MATYWKGIRSLGKATVLSSFEDVTLVPSAVATVFSWPRQIPPKRIRTATIVESFCSDIRSARQPGGEVAENVKP
jgi:hypothetical protein